MSAAPLRGAARAIGIPTSELMALIGYGSAADPFLDREEAVRWVRHTVLTAPAGVATAEEQALVVRVLDAVVDELQARAATAQDTTDAAGTADESDALAVVADGAARVERIETAEAP